MIDVLSLEVSADRSPVSDLLIKPFKAAIIEMKRGFLTGRRLVVAKGNECF